MSVHEIGKQIKNQPTAGGRDQNLKPVVVRIQRCNGCSDEVGSESNRAF